MLIEKNRKNNRLPDFLIVGAARSGTTTLYYYLRKHPKIFMPEIKEPFFFSFMNAAQAYVSPDSLGRIICKFEDYTKLFENATDSQIIGEASTSYLYTHKTSIENIKKVYGKNYKELKIIIILRNPAERAWSQYMMFIRDGNDPLDFEDAIKPDTIAWRLKNNWNIFYDFIGFGMYHEQVKAFTGEFPYIKVFLYKNFIDDNLKILYDIFDFLGVEKTFKPDINNKYNVSGMVKFRFLHEFLYQKKSILKDIFKPFVPYDTRQKIKYKILEKNILRAELSTEQKKNLLKIFEKDILKLQKLLKMDLSE